MKAPRSLLAVENLVSAILFALTPACPARQSYALSDPEPISVSGMLAAMRAGLGRGPGLLPVPEAWLRRLARLAGREETSSSWREASSPVRNACSGLAGSRWLNEAGPGASGRFKIAQAEIQDRLVEHSIGRGLVIGLHRRCKSRQPDFDPVAAGEDRLGRHHAVEPGFGHRLVAGEQISFKRSPSQTPETTNRISSPGSKPARRIIRSAMSMIRIGWPILST